MGKFRDINNNMTCHMTWSQLKKDFVLYNLNERAMRGVYITIPIPMTSDPDAIEELPKRMKAWCVTQFEVNTAFPANKWCIKYNDPKGFFFEMRILLFKGSSQDFHTFRTRCCAQVLRIGRECGLRFVHPTQSRSVFNENPDCYSHPIQEQVLQFP